MLAENPLRTNYQQHFEEIVAAYNGEKDRVTIEMTFEALMKFVGGGLRLGAGDGFGLRGKGSGSLSSLAGG